DRQDLEVRRALVDGIVATVERAADRLAPARLGVGAVDAPPVTVGRLAPAPDPELIVVKVVSSTGTPIALGGNYALHGTIAPPWRAVPLGRAFPTAAVLTAGSIGPAAWVTIPGELASALGRRIKDVGRDERVRSPARPASPPFVAGLSNDYLGYFLEPDAYGG